MLISPYKRTHDNNCPDKARTMYCMIDTWLTLIECVKQFGPKRSGERASQGID